jgi:hypothetical protein
MRTGKTPPPPSELMAFHRAEIVLVRPRSIPYLAARGLRARRTWATARTGGIGRSGLLRVVLRVGDVVEPGDELTVRLRVGAPSRFWHKLKHEAALVEAPPLEGVKRLRRHPKVTSSRPYGRARRVGDRSRSTAGCEGWCW